MKDVELEKISKLLALRDGDLTTVDDSESSLDDESRDMLSRLRNIQADLRALDDVEVERSVWDSPLRHVDPLPRQRSVTGWRFPLASAAAAFLVSVVGVLLVYQQIGPQTGTDALPSYGLIAGAQQESQLVTLMNRSMELEQVAYNVDDWRTRTGGGVAAPNNADALMPSPIGQYILYQLAQVDGEIAALHDADTMDSTRRLELWKERVNLLQAFVADMARHNPDVYQDTRSM